MKRIILLLTIGCMISFTNCVSKKEIVGLWQIEKVQMGDQEMTPIAKWTKLNKDKTQQSGNGWVQHTVGSWNYDKETNTLTLENSNGPKDEFGGFTVDQLDNESMKWTRMEDGQEISVYLNKTNELPQAPADQLLGVWRLKSDATTTQSYLFFRWDHILIDRKQGEGKKYGLYKTHGHKPELQIIYYSDPLKQVIWNYSYQNGELILQGTPDGEAVTHRYERINYFPE